MRVFLNIIVALIISVALSLPVAAHHGWGWTSDEWFELSGTVTEIYVGNPHATLQVEAEGQVWDIDLAPLSRTLNAGFDEDVVSVGDSVILIGHRATDPDEYHMKAVRVVIGDQTYDVYPDFAADYDRQANA